MKAFTLRFWAGVAVRWRVLLVLAGGCGAFHSAVFAADGTVAREYQIKAAFLYNFTKFVEWPPQHFAGDDQPIVIGVFGPNPFGRELVEVVSGRRVNGRAIVVVTVDSSTEGDVADIIFVRAGEEGEFKRLIDGGLRPGTLLVGESERFTAQGGMITFVQERDHIRFEIDIAAAEQSGLKLSAQLLKLARTVRGRG